MSTIQILRLVVLAFMTAFEFPVVIIALIYITSLLSLVLEESSLYLFLPVPLLLSLLFVSRVSLLLFFLDGVVLR